MVVRRRLNRVSRVQVYARSNFLSIVMQMESSPPRRSTRSGSSSSSITLNDIKTLINDLRVEFINEVKDLKEIISSLQTDVKALEKTNSLLQEKYDKVECELKIMKARQAEAAFEIADEVEDRLRRRHNVIISGVPESSSNSSQTDFDICTDILDIVCEDEVIPVNVRRVGKREGSKPRLLKVQVKDVESRTCILRRAKELRKVSRHKGVFINPDRTPQEQSRFKALLRELKQRKEMNEDVVIFRNRIVHRSDIRKNF